MLRTRSRTSVKDLCCKVSILKKWHLVWLLNPYPDELAITLSRGGLRIAFEIRCWEMYEVRSEFAFWVQVAAETALKLAKAFEADAVQKTKDAKAVHAALAAAHAAQAALAPKPENESSSEIEKEPAVTTPPQQSIEA